MQWIKTKSVLSVFLIIAVFYFSLISVDNVGGQVGIITPYNLSVYFAVVVFIIYSFYQVISFQQFQISSRLLWTLIAAINLIAVGYWQAIHLNFLHYVILALVVAVLFVLALEQVSLSENAWHWLFYALSILALLQSLIALIQYFDTFSVAYWWTGYFPFKIHSGFLGSLQQRNMLSSFIAFGLVLSLWLLFSAQFKQSPIKIKLPLFLLAALGGFVVFASGSRAGLLALAVGILLLLWTYRFELKSHLGNLLLWFSLLVTSALLVKFIGVDIGSAASKFERVVYGLDVRLFLYETGWKLFLENLWFGVGIGNYNHSLQDFVLAHQLPGDARIAGLEIGSFSHPHNEFLFWLIQVGLAGCFSILIVIFLILKNWWQQGQKAFWGYSAIISPLVIQSMVSYPFILSATHWFLVLLVVFYSVIVSQRTINISLSESASLTFKVALLSFVAVAAYGFYIGLMSAFETYYFKNRIFIYKDYPQQEQVGYFYNASKWGLYDDLVQANMENMFLNARRDNNLYDLKQYLLWYNNQTELPDKFNDYAAQSRAMLQSNDAK
ncbi:O-antigen ligase family protein [Thiomicrorhabdus sediminis]|uniref:O-antigen ligase family protein n=1 Tax=Thiomicrorhabdus sediminis TaxID=2580412 RepID=A0A4P9K8N9_9GAMM|nr:O-antigen ligase family protein [Thiomicrorhabdus sediminis]QCU90776.1 O-antigen ligase family protein [Thiomicrorhabdus sediminis]